MKKEKNIQQVIIPLNLAAWYKLLRWMTEYWFKETICRLSGGRYFRAKDTFLLTIIALDGKKTDLRFPLHPDALTPAEMKELVCSNKKK